MAQERLTLRKIREILRLKEEAGLSNRAIARACKISNSTVGDYLRRAGAAGVHWPLPEDADEDELFKRLFPDIAEAKPVVRPVPDWEEVREELKKKGVTLKLLWQEYREESQEGMAILSTASIISAGQRPNRRVAVLSTGVGKSWKWIMPD